MIDQMGRLTKYASFLVVLDTMWGHTTKDAERWFPINPDNHSGRRLYRLTGCRFPHVWVTNACPQQTNHATKHGKPSPTWLWGSLWMLDGRAKDLPLLVCGKVAQETFRLVVGHGHRGPVIRLKHPAARTWSEHDIAVAINTIKRKTHAR